MGTRSISKTINFFIYNNEEVDAIMGKKGTLEGVANVSLYDEDSFAIPEYDIDFLLYWTADGDDSRYLVRDIKFDDVSDLIMSKMNEADFLELNDDYDVNLSSFTTERKRKENNARLSSLKIAIEHFMAGEAIEADAWEKFDDEELIAELSNRLIWAPFEHYEYGEIIDRVEDLAYTIEKEMLKCQKTN